VMFGTEFKMMHYFLFLSYMRFWQQKKNYKKYSIENLFFISSQQKDFVGLSFPTISIYLIDSGAQYLDRTTDLTRTVHFGTPSDYEKGHIAVSAAVFPNETKGHLLDSFARASLWDSGLDYLHGTGHGVRCFLNVHEGPCGISYKTFADEPLEAGMIVSDEPGYYEDGSFGIRLENVVLVIPAKTKYNYRNRGSLTFEPLTLVPIQLKMINTDLLTQKEVRAALINRMSYQYHARHNSYTWFILPNLMH
uniref:X-prolyl aminopeptidase (aminopeptidase P) 1, soluble n=1 Tax=Sinocyclocheilus grahami TaxID=75366 RepID=A0A672TD50_SINGR